jgi:hypothetical protein
MPLISIDTAANIVGVTATQLRLFLSRYGAHIIPPSVQGRQRPIPDSALLPITLAFLIARDLGAPLAKAGQLAQEIVHAHQGNVDLDALRAHLTQSTADHLAHAPNPPRRGRPPRS